MAVVENVNAVIAALKRKASGQPKDVSVAVGYTQNYAIYVHENLEAHHEVGQAKYLEEPLRRLAPELAKIVRENLPKVGLEKALLLAGLRLQRESQLLVPVDTSALKASAFTALDRDLPEATAAAHAAGEAVRGQNAK